MEIDKWKSINEIYKVRLTRKKAKKRGKTFKPLTHTLVKTPVKVEGLTRRIRLSKKTWRRTFFPIWRTV